MATHILDGTAPVRLPRGPLSVSVRTTGSPARLEPYGVDPHGVDPHGVDPHDGLQRRGDVETPVVRPAAHLVILPRLTGPVVLRVVPTGDLVFGPGSSVTLTLGIEGAARGHDPEQALLPAVDLTGLPHRDLLVVEPGDDGLVVRAAAPVDDEAVPGLAGLARAATRRVLGVDRVPQREAVRMVVSLDASASGRLLARSGATAAVTEVLLGVSRVVATEPPRVAVVAGDDLTWVPTSTDVATVAHASGEAVAAVPPTIGFRAAHPELRSEGRREEVVTYLVTDGTPADVGDLPVGSSGDAVAHGGAQGARWHLVVVGDAAPGPVRLPGSADLALPVTHVRTVDGESLAERLTGSPARLDEVVRALLRGCLHPGSELARRATP